MKNATPQTLDRRHAQRRMEIEPQAEIHLGGVVAEEQREKGRRREDRAA